MLPYECWSRGAASALWEEASQGQIGTRWRTPGPAFAVRSQKNDGVATAAHASSSRLALALGSPPLRLLGAVAQHHLHRAGERRSRNNKTRERFVDDDDDRPRLSGAT